MTFDSSSDPTTFPDEGKNVHITGRRNPSCRHVRRRLHLSTLRSAQTANLFHQQVDARIYALSLIAIPFFGKRFAGWANPRVLKWRFRRTCRTPGFGRPVTGP